jgi:UPF0042 nucleotide-binding protein
MPQLIVSFGFNKGVPVAGDDDNGGSLDVIDVRTVLSRNPFRDKKLRTKRGTDPEVQADIQMTPDFLLSMQILKDRVEMSTEKVFYIGCTGGHHRSVYAAILIGKALGIPVKHRDIGR